MEITKIEKNGPIPNTICIIEKDRDIRIIIEENRGLQFAGSDPSITISDLEIIKIISDNFYLFFNNIGF